MPNYRPGDSKREEFRKYLERTGVLEALTRVLASLYEESEKVPEALEFVRKHLVQSHPGDGGENEEDLKSTVTALREENKMLRERLGQYEEVPPPTSVTPTRKTEDEASVGPHITSAAAGSPALAPESRAEASQGTSDPPSQKSVE